MRSKVGWLGSILLAFCGAPEAYRAVTDPQYDIALLFVLMWGVGEVITLYAVYKDAKLGYLLFNYGMNILFISIILGRILYERICNI